MKILRPEVEKCIISGGNMQDLFDNVIKVLFNITDDEYNYIIEYANDSELEIFVNSLGTLNKSSTFAQRRLALKLRNEKLIQFKEATN